MAFKITLTNPNILWNVNVQIATVWSSPSSCTKSCGGGTLDERRHKIVRENHGGTCFGTFERRTDCNTRSCPSKFYVIPTYYVWFNCIIITCYILSVHCQWSEWTYLSSDCSKKCGGGTQKETRHKIVEENPGGTCSGAAERKTDCNTQSCIGKFYQLQGVPS